MSALKYSLTSQARLATADPRLQHIFQTVLDLGFDHSILCGERGEKEQNDAVARGASKTPYPKSKHNKKPSLAVDVQPYPARVTDKRWPQDCVLFAGIVIGVAASLGYKLRWGGDWNQNSTTTDENGLIDFPHFELGD